MTKKDIIRVGDRVTLTDPRPIIKVGYDRDIDTIYQEMKNDLRILTFCINLQLREKDRESVIKAVSRSILASSLRSGTERKIFYGKMRENLLNQLLRGVEARKEDRELLWTIRRVRLLGGI